MIRPGRGASHTASPALFWASPVLLGLISLLLACRTLINTAARTSWQAISGAILGAGISCKTAGRLTLAGVLGAIVILALVNNLRGKPDMIGNAADLNETVIYRQNPTLSASMQREALRRALEQKASTRLASLQPTSAPASAVEDEGEPLADEIDESPAVPYAHAVQTVKFVNAADAGLSPDEQAAMTKVGAFVAFPGKQASDPAKADGSTDWPAAGRYKAAANMEEVDRYLWDVYQRQPIKKDHSGDFTWKDPASAKRMGLSMPEYVIGGMDPEFKEQLYHAGKAMDAAGIEWSMLSAFRDDYRQKLAAGFKARVGNSLHGGSRATGGYGHGRAIDLTTADGEASVAWKWIDAHGGKFGLFRPIPGPDPAHVQSRGDWRKLALTLRESRLRSAVAESAATGASGKGKVAKASW
jgi:hypothetical protein